jgi:indoleacetamide hydrolase
MMQVMRSTRINLSRRLFLAGTAATAVLAREAMAVQNETSDLTQLSATDAIARMSRGEMSVETYTTSLLERCERERALNAFISLDAARVLKDARVRDAERRAGLPCGPLFGLPVPIKDSINTQDYPTTAGTRALRNFRPAADAPVVAKLRSAGALVLGKTNLHELSFGWTSDNRVFGAVHNPYDRTRVPGGSSGGTAAAIAARLAPLGIAEDTEGSIRVPAAFCGITGFRPTTGRYPTQGCAPISHLFDQVGPHARHVKDLALFDRVISSESEPVHAKSLRGVRLAVVRDYWFGELDPEVREIAEAALRRLREAGVLLVETVLPELAGLIERTTSVVQLHDAAPELAQYLKTFAAGVTLEQLVAEASDDIREVFQNYVLPVAPHAISAEQYATAVNVHLPKLRRLFQDFFVRNDVAALVFPATMVPPTLIGEDTTVSTADGRKLPFEVAVARNIAPGSTAGLPGLVLPAGITQKGLPVALEFDGPTMHDRQLLSIGLSLEQALGPIRAPA